MRSVRNAMQARFHKWNRRNYVILSTPHLPSPFFSWNRKFKRNVSDHQTFLFLIWQNLLYHGLGWLELNTLFSKDILINMFSRIPCRIATVYGDDNAGPTNLESSSSESNTETLKKGSLALCVISFEWKEQDQGSISKNLWFSVKSAGLSITSSEDLHEVKICYSKRTTYMKS